ncbi:membrane-bound ClpP family serine protease [Paenibacillus phyllosphaerae]|uniref:Membrane-bound ClpP family serine protease n=1 Tax=Paenibacillus phyllosphaerae TaxID=274593 RepID=A0A7W5FRE2_9BACL|nr:NfeD family protein [Paenibacillus phyllosphaerae]MBB3114431.1 membrane-bound ClpP family serine protease [Paenibacillus phyllosphaerae]
MEALFWTCLSFGILYAIIAVVLGDWLSLAFHGALDFLSIDGHKLLQPTSLVGSITIFGGAGLMLERYSSLEETVVLLVSLLIAIPAGLGIYFVYIRPMERSENSTGYSITELMGAIGEVLTPVPAIGYGEVLLKKGASVTHHIAASFDQETIPSGAKVVVIEVDVQEGTLLVSKLDL